MKTPTRVTSPPNLDLFETKKEEEKKKQPSKKVAKAVPVQEISLVATTLPHSIMPTKSAPIKPEDIEKNNNDMDEFKIELA